MRSPLFQFTHPGKGATASKSAVDVLLPVSIHAPWEGCDLALVEVSDGLLEFQFTHPGKGATTEGVWSDYRYVGFNSRTLGRVRRAATSCLSLSGGKFQFTHPGKGATGLRFFVGVLFIVSIHAPWEGCDLHINSGSIPS